MSSELRRIGIYSGSFDPVHAGHVSFALQALVEAKLDRLYFLPERRHPDKPGVEHFGHRVAMLNRAILPHAKLGVLELEDVSFSVERTLPRLRKRLPGSQLVLLLGSDVVPKLPTWPKADTLLAQTELVVGVRAGDSQEQITKQIHTWPMQPKALAVLDSYAADVTSHGVREALRRRQYVRGTLESVRRYSEHHWLYVSLA